MLPDVYPLVSGSSLTNPPLSLYGVLSIPLLPQRYRTYEVLKEETANPRVRWAYLPYSMHMAGPREVSSLTFD